MGKVSVGYSIRTYRVSGSGYSVQKCSKTCYMTFNDGVTSRILI